MKDFLTNHLLSIKNTIIHLFGIKPKFDAITSDRGIKSDTYFDFTNMDKGAVKNYFQFKPDWGDYHPKNLIQWYDSAAVTCTKFGLELAITNNFYKDTSVLIGTGVGYVMSRGNYGYGLYEWNVTLPKGKQLWPAIWLTDNLTWPPEIDVLEAYSDDKMKYGRRLNSNVYYPNQPKEKQIGGMNHGNLIDKSKSLNLKLLWVYNTIEIYYNNYLVRKITDEKVIKHFQGRQMRVIMNNAIRKESLISEMAVDPFIIYDFAYYSI